MLLLFLVTFCYTVSNSITDHSTINNNNNNKGLTKKSIFSSNVFYFKDDTYLITVSLRNPTSNGFRSSSSGCASVANVGVAVCRWLPSVSPSESRESWDFRPCECDEPASSSSDKQPPPALDVSLKTDDIPPAPATTPAVIRNSGSTYMCIYIYNRSRKIWMKTL